MARMPITSTTAEREDDAPAVLPRGIDSLLIQRATVAHVPYLRVLKERVMRDRYRPAPDEEGFDRWRQVYCTDDYFATILDDDTCMLLCIGTIRDPVGMVVLRRSGTHLEIDDLLVLTPRHGDGTRLLVAALRYAEVWRILDVHIDVYPGNAHAEAFLREHGFHLERETQNDLGHPMLRFERAIR
jgi:GNAT superfamily N-acetyltransferase